MYSELSNFWSFRHSQKKLFLLLHSVFDITTCCWNIMFLFEGMLDAIDIGFINYVFIQRNFLSIQIT